MIHLLNKLLTQHVEGQSQTLVYNLAFITAGQLREFTGD